MKILKIFMLIFCIFLTSGCSTPDQHYFESNKNFSTRQKFELEQGRENREIEGGKGTAYCEAIAYDAKRIMYARQSGEPMDKLLLSSSNIKEAPLYKYLIQNPSSYIFFSEHEIEKLVIELRQEMIQRAFQTPIYSTDREIEEAVSDFKYIFHSTCVKNLFPAKKD